MILDESEQEEQLLDKVQQLVISYKKQINEAKRDKERLQIQVKTSEKTIENLVKKRDALNEDSNKLLLDFRDAM